MGWFCISLIPYFLFVAYKTKKSLHMLQQNYYDESQRYFLWILKNQKKVWLEVDIWFPVLLLINFIPKEFGMASVAIFYGILFLGYKKKIGNDQNKKPLVVTSRIKRLIVTIVILHLMVIVPMVYLQDAKMLVANYLFLGFLAYLNYLVVGSANFLNIPVEKSVYLHYRRQAVRKLKELNVPVIGITGSYGKTSSKNIISDILNVRFNAYATPASYNTAYGLILTVNKHLDKFNNYFITEMGAFKRGEIRTSCNIVKPTYGVLTVIGEAHLESFGSRKNIQKGKFELIESLQPNGFAVLNGDDEYQREYKLKNNCQVFWIGIENTDVDAYATNIKLSHTGTSFDVKFKDDDTFYSFQTKLLGKHNIYNILGGILLGKKLGMSNADLIRGVATIKTIEHRLELKKIGTLNIIDDAYNSNPVGSKMAVEVLGMMPGTKIIVTPGMIELGTEQYELNKKFGTYIAEQVDYAILIGQEQTRPIYDGLMTSNFPKDKIYVLNDVKDAFPLMKTLEKDDTYVLLENDLPDLFSE